MTVAQPASIRVRVRVQWIDTDAAGIYHWTTVARFAETAEAALHTALGIAGETFGASPRVSVTLQFRSPLRFNDEALVTLAVVSLGRSSVRYRIDVRAPDGAEVASGELVSCLVDPRTGRPRPWPDDVRRMLGDGGPQPGD